MTSKLTVSYPSWLSKGGCFKHRPIGANLLLSAMSLSLLMLQFRATGVGGEAV